MKEPAIPFESSIVAHLNAWNSLPGAVIMRTGPAQTAQELVTYYMIIDG